MRNLFYLAYELNSGQRLNKANLFLIINEMRINKRLIINHGCIFSRIARAKRAHIPLTL